MKKLSFLRKLKKLLPSKNFFIFTGIGLGFVGLIFLIFFFFGGKESFASKKSNLALKDKTVADLIQKDSDGDSIPDWEEALWGTDKNNRKTFDDTPDVVYIENKKKDLKQEGDVGENTANETDKFAREFFSAYAAMKESNVDNTTINNFSSAIGQKVADPKLIDRYSMKDVHKNLIDSVDEKAIYYQKIRDLFDAHTTEGIGDELGIVSTGVITYDSSGTANMDELLIIADAYTTFASEVMQTPVPESLATIHLEIANSANNTGISVGNMTKVINDPIVGLSGLSQYQKYSNDLIKAVKSLEDAL